MTDPATTTAPTKPKRTIHWCTRELYQFIRSRENTPFAWGTNCCAMFAADAIQAMTGVDIASDFRGLYSDAAGAQAAIEKITGVKGGTIEDAAAYCANKHGLPEWKYPLQAQRGDLVIFGDVNGPTAGIIHISGKHILAPGEKGLKKLSIHDGKTSPIKRAWHV